ncbi:hypothetical protein NDN08_004749 [Rhodosorus marinus]|uniref:SRR1-like domain-containing protein n=1 Tax=Rhodosorus marinus TaxID=101924 RepID=A0AAV8UQQ9_9RHOD|nr:hypothetical protein NDN08_004749 [Rhodosorus marinus]
MSDNGWKVAGKGKGRWRHKPALAQSLNRELTLEDLDKARDDILLLEKQLLSSSLWNSTKSALSETLERFQWDARELSFRAYGLGSFCRTRESRRQIVFAKALVAHLKILGDVFVFEPQFHEYDSILAKELAFTASPLSDDALFSAASPTLFFMPHCPRQLYNNVLQSNWKATQLSNAMIIGNKFSNYYLQIRPRQMRSYLETSEAIMEEKAIDVEYKTEWYNAFNDQAVITFAKAASIPIDDPLWSFSPDPAAVSSTGCT